MYLFDTPMYVSIYTYIHIDTYIGVSKSLNEPESFRVYDRLSNAARSPSTSSLLVESTKWTAIAYCLPGDTDTMLTQMVARKPFP